MKWNKLDVTIRRSEFYNLLKAFLLKLDRPSAKPTYNIHNPIALKVLIRLRLDLNHLN